MNLLEVKNLTVSFLDTCVIKDVSFTIAQGQRVGLIGESGCGKSVTALALMGLLDTGAKCGGSITLNGKQLVGLPDRAMAKLRGAQIGMIFQEPMTALDPTMQVGRQVAEVLLLHRRERSARNQAIEMLARVGLRDPERVAVSYPDQLSGGQRQRVLLAMALINAPALLICDEPTTALDVTVQAKVLKLLDTELAKVNAGCLFISHDLSVVSNICDYLLVMYAGRIVEAGKMSQVLNHPQHPYTQGLLATADISSANPNQRLPMLSDFWQAHP
uniref:ABC transporter ATP-binding protein n=1 Tax=Vaginimicrobium propionicum TaxID=1871034 RepID=UPI0009702882|nr:ABC transporter ATP-binding protein [Vaginimicrobium propionicum]